MRVSTVFSLIAAIFVLIIAASSLYIVREGQQAIVLRLGKLQYENDQNLAAAVKQPGLHFKWPFIEQVKRFDVRLQTFEPRPSRIVTGEQKDVLVDYFVKWKIDKPGLYFKRTTGNSIRARSLLNQQVNDKLRAEFGQRTIADVVAEDRSLIMTELTELVNKSASRLGLKVIDVRIKRIDLPDEVSERVFERMRTARRVVATKHRATGKAEAEAIRARSQAKATVMVAEAKKKAADFRAQGDATAAKIYADVYQRNPDFYEFYRSIDAYKQVFANNNDILVLRPDSQFFKFFGGVHGQAK